MRRVVLAALVVACAALVVVPVLTAKDGNSGGNSANAGPASQRLSVNVRGPSASAEPSAANFTLRLSRAAPSRVAVRYSTVDGTATSGSDYVAKRGSLVFARGQRIKTVRIVVKDDSAPEAAESFSLVVSPARGVRVRGGRASAAIAKNDLPTFTLVGMMNGANEAADGRWQG